MDSIPCTVLVPAAGRSERYAEKLGALPKGLMRFLFRGSRATMIEHCLLCTPSALPVRVVCRVEDAPLFRERLYGLSDTASVVRPISDTLGQADTVVQGSADAAGDILVINCDNSLDFPLSMFIKSCRNDDANAGAVVFNAVSERYGYIDDFPFFLKGAEKVPISEWALAGAFYFKNRQVLQEAFYCETVRRDGESRRALTKEIYLSQLFEHIRSPKRAYSISPSTLHEWGTPAELERDPQVWVDWRNV